MFWVYKIWERWTFDWLDVTGRCDSTWIFHLPSTVCSNNNREYCEPLKEFYWQVFYFLQQSTGGSRQDKINVFFSLFLKKVGNSEDVSSRKVTTNKIMLTFCFTKSWKNDIGYCRINSLSNVPSWQFMIISLLFT